MPWTCRMTAWSRLGLVSSSGVNCRLVPYKTSRWFWGNICCFFVWDSHYLRPLPWCTLPRRGEIFTLSNSTLGQCTCIWCLHNQYKSRGTLGVQRQDGPHAFYSHIRPQSHQQLGWKQWGAICGTIGWGEWRICSSPSFPGMHGAGFWRYFQIEGVCKQPCGSQIISNLWGKSWWGCIHLQTLGGCWRV